MSKKNYRFETLQLHVGQEQADPATDARAVPIYQTTSYVFHNSQHAADRFGLRDAGNIYGRLTNSTQGVFEDRVAALEGGVAGLAVASGAAAITYALQNIVQNGDHIVAADNLYGGSYNLITHTLATQGISNTIINVNDLEALEAAIKPNTKVVYAETFGNPNSDVLNLEGVAAVAHKHGIPFIVDNTFGTPYLIRPLEHGADIVVHSATKFLGGHGSSLGGVIVDGGKFDWKANDKFPTLSKPDPSYHGIVFADAVGAAAYVTRIRAVILRDTGASGFRESSRPRTLQEVFPQWRWQHLHLRDQGRTGRGVEVHRCPANLLAAGKCRRREESGNPPLHNHALTALT